MMTTTGRTAAARRLATIVATLAASAVCAAHAGLGQALPQGPYFGLTPPGSRPEVFAPGIVSTDAHEFACSFTPDGREFYFTRMTSPGSPTLIMVSRMVDGAWTEPEPAPFNHPSARMSFEPMVTPDGRRLYFSSDRPLDARAAPGGPPSLNLWYVEREGDGWGEPKEAGAPFNPMRAMYASTTRAGVLYTTDISSGMGREGIGVARPEGGAYAAIERLGEPVNAGAANLYPFIAPDEEYLVFTRREGGPGSATALYVSFRTPDGSWGEPAAVELGMPAGVPSVSPDGKYLFVTAGERGKSDIYWVSTDVLRPGRR
jgi:Tol biopolymer transport system component